MSKRETIETGTILQFNENVRSEIMKALEFPTIIESNGTISVPAEIAANIPANHEVRVLLLLPEENEEEDKEWKRYALEQFFKDDYEGDAVYDSIPIG